jgi:CRP/FNR family transcriptional regulator, cyclic AMP receptor protein
VTTPTDISTLSKLYMFKSVPPASLAELCALAPPVHFLMGQAVFLQGANADVALLLIEGRLIATVTALADDKEVGQIRPGEIVGEQGLFVEGGSRSASVIAAEPSTCLMLTPDVMDHAFHNPAIVALEQHMLGTLARRIRGTNQAIQKVWKDVPDPNQPKAPAQAAKPTLRDRLAGLFGGR